MEGPFEDIATNMDGFAAIFQDGRLLIWGRSDVFGKGQIMVDLKARWPNMVRKQRF